VTAFPLGRHAEAMAAGAAGAAGSVMKAVLTT
jgi:hypothetical protein